MKQIDGGITAVPGIRAAGIHAGIKAADAKDVTPGTKHTQPVSYTHLTLPTICSV